MALYTGACSSARQMKKPYAAFSSPLPHDCSRMGDTMQIHGLNKTTLLDYPGHLAATVFSGSCDFRCPFCHNASLVLRPSSQPVLPEEEVLAFLRKRKSILEGVCITGGEPTLQKDLPLFIEKVKETGLKVKLDTNGGRPAMIRYLIQEGLLDYIAVDIKNSPEHYALSVGIRQPDLAPIRETVSLLLEGQIPYEFRTTVIREHHTADDFRQIGEWIQGADAYYLQAFKDSGDLISQDLSGYSKAELEEFLSIVSPYVKHCELRGID